MGCSEGVVLTPTLSQAVTLPLAIHHPSSVKGELAAHQGQSGAPYLVWGDGADSRNTALCLHDHPRSLQASSSQQGHPQQWV